MGPTQVQHLALVSNHLHFHVTCSDSCWGGRLTCPALGVLLSDIRLVPQQDADRLRVPQGDRQVQQASPAGILLVDILGKGEGELF